MAFRVLSVDSEIESWRALVMGLDTPCRDIHFLPEYASIYDDIYGFKAHLAVYQDGNGCIIQPFVRRPLKSLSFLAPYADAGDFFDIANAYGYGGPLATSTSGRDSPEDQQSLYAKFDEKFSAWCNENRIASEFAGLHPFFANTQAAMIGNSLPLKHEKDVVFIDLLQDEDELLKSLRKGHRSSITLAKRSGFQLEKVEATAANLARFHAIYEETMKRRQAASRWYVPRRFFESTASHLGEDQVSLFFLYSGAEIESGCLLIHAFSSAYYHFAGTRSMQPALGGNNLMVWEAAMWAKRAGYDRLHLGGGVTSAEDDSLLRFKAGFSPARAPLYTYFTVRNEAVYSELCARKQQHEMSSSTTVANADFLPMYRRGNVI